jgi:esterase/lipase
LTYTYRFPTRSTRFDSDMANHTLDDLRAAITFMRQQGAQRLVLVGASLGGMATAKAASTENPAAVMIIASPVDLSEFDFRVEETELDAIAAPKLFVGSQGDQNVPFAEVQRMFDLSPQPKQLHAYDSNAHGVELFKTEHGDDLRQRLIAFVETNAPAEPALLEPKLLAEPRFPSGFIAILLPTPLPGVRSASTFSAASSCIPGTTWL